MLFGLAISISAPLFAGPLDDAQRMIRKGQYVQALEAVDSQLAANPNDPQAGFLKVSSTARRTAATMRSRFTPS